MHYIQAENKQKRNKDVVIIIVIVNNKNNIKKIQQKDTKQDIVITWIIEEWIEQIIRVSIEEEKNGINPSKEIREYEEETRISPCPQHVSLIEIAIKITEDGVWIIG